MKANVLAFSRTSYCETCYKNGSPKKDDLAVIFHTQKGKPIIHKLTKGNTKGYTPHLFMIDTPVPNTDNVTLDRICGICGFSLSDLKDDGTREYKIIADDTEITLPKKQFIALWKKFKDTGYEV